MSSFKNETGPKRLRRMAKLCQVFGQRVQYSVFEIEVDVAQWTQLKNDLIKVMDEEEDSLRIYYLGNNSGTPCRTRWREENYGFKWFAVGVMRTCSEHKNLRRFACSVTI